MIKMTKIENGNVSIADCFDDYMDRCKARNLSSKTLSLYQVHFSVFQKYIDCDNTKPAELNQHTIDGFVLYLQERGCNQITVQSYMRDTRAFFYYLMDNGLTNRFKIMLPKADIEEIEGYISEGDIDEAIFQISLIKDAVSEYSHFADKAYEYAK